MKTALAALVGLGLAGSGQAAALQFQQSLIRPPVAARPWLGWRVSSFSDVDHDGLQDLVVLGERERRLWVYRQRASGFPPAPDQAVELPAETGWAALADVDPRPGMELVISTASGVFCCCQKDGRFESERRVLMDVRQVFSGGTRALLTRLGEGATPSIPAIQARQAVPYRRTAPWTWEPQSPSPLQAGDGGWGTNPSDWATASDPSHELLVSRLFRGVPGEEARQRKAADKAPVARILEGLEKDRPAHLSEIHTVDVDGNRSRDLVLWRIADGLDPMTDVFIFRRGADGQLPERPSQIVHGRGLPVAAGGRQALSPLCDLDGDGVCELVLAALKTPVMSAGSLVDMALSRGIDWRITIRRQKGGVFASRAEEGPVATTVLPTESGFEQLLVLEGDLNGDHRPDLLAKRAPDQREVYLSTTAGGWFAPRPALTLRTQGEGYLEFLDLNGDGLEDIVMRSYDEPCLEVFVSRRAATPGGMP